MEGMDFGNQCPGSIKCPLTGDHILLHKQELVCGDSIHNKFSHPGLQTIGTRLKTGISKQLQHCMNGNSVIIRN